MTRSLAVAGLRNTISSTWGRPSRAHHFPAAPVRQDPLPHPLAGDGLPGVAQEIADVLGQERALYLIGQLPRCYVGREGAKSWQPMLYVPKTLKPDHPLVDILGTNEAQALTDAFGGEQLKPPTCADIYRRFRDRSIASLVGEGLSPELVADITGARVPVVKRILKNRV